MHVFSLKWNVSFVLVFDKTTKEIPVVGAIRPLSITSFSGGTFHKNSHDCSFFSK